MHSAKLKHGDGKEKDPEKESVLEVEAEVVQAQQPLSAKDEENISSGAVPAGDAEGGSNLPFSKARCIALVLTVTCAAFLNVCSI